MTSTALDLIDIIDQLNEARLMAEAACLACGGMQMRQEGEAVRAVVGAVSDNLKDALGKLEAMSEASK